MSRNTLLPLLLSVFSLLRLSAQPAWVEAEVRWADASGSEQRLRGQLQFQRLPVERERTGNFHITNLVPLREGEIRIAAENRRFVLHDYQGAHSFQWTRDDLPLEQRGAARADALDTSAPPSLDLEPANPALAEEVAPADFSLRLADAPPVPAIPLASIREIRFGTLADGGFKREEYRGRFVSYSRAARGDNGTVQPVAATFFGGAEDESFSHGGFFPDGRIFAGGTFFHDEFPAARGARVLGPDTRRSDFPPETRTDRRGREQIHQPASTGLIAVFSPDLSRLEQVFRFPWGAGHLQTVTAGTDGSLFAVLRLGPAGESLANAVRVVATAENPGHVEQARARAAARAEEPRLNADSLLLKINPARGTLEWGVRFKHGWVELAVLDDGELMVRRGGQLFHVSPRDGSLREGARIQIISNHTGMIIDPRNGNIFFGGEYHSHTGLEPWRCPYLRKFRPDGTPVWSAYDWTGPIVGVEFLRLVSDSAVTGAHAGRNGTLLLSGWSDGGNSVFTRQPYDMRQPVDVGGTASSIWGASVLSVSYLIQMDADTMDVHGVTRFLSYLPTSDTPNSISLRAFHQLDSGDVAVLGGSAFGLIETHDAWFDPWYLQFQRNRHAQARGGPFLVVYRNGLRELRLSTILPGFRPGGLASQGSRLLIFGSAAERNHAYGDETPAFTRQAVQAGFGGGQHDAYLMLVETAADPHPPVIPEKSW